MKILFIYRANNIHLLRRAQALHEMGHDIFYLGFYPKDSDIDLANFKFIKFINIHPIIKGKLTVLDFVANFLRVRNIIKSEAIDIIHIQSPIYFLSILTSKFNLVIENMGSDVLKLPRYNLLRRLLFYFAFKSANAVIQDSFISKKAAIKLGANSKKSYVIDIGVETNEFLLHESEELIRKQLLLSQDCRVILSIRSMLPNSNIELILHSLDFLDLKKTIILFLTYPSYPSLRNLLAEYKQKYPDNIKVLGYVDNKTELPKILKISDIVLSVPHSDSSPLSVLEAMGAEVPVIVQKHNWYKGKFIEGKHLLACDNNPAHLAERIEFIFKNNIDFSKLALKRVHQRYSRNQNHLRLQKLYSNICNNLEWKK